MSGQGVVKESSTSCLGVIISCLGIVKGVSRSSLVLVCLGVVKELSKNELSTALG